MVLQQLLDSISQTSDYFQKEAVKQVNIALTLRNWIIGFYLYEYEQKGQDRAVYGEKLHKEISTRLKHIKGLSKSQLYRYKDFYLGYPQIFPTVLGKFKDTKNIFIQPILQSVLAIPSTQTLPTNDPKLLLERLSFSHFIELLNADTPLKRIFYEVETIKNNWNVRELQRAIETALYERTGLSIDKEGVIKMIKEKKALSPFDIIRNPYILEFLDLEEKSKFSENDLETAIINDLQNFLIELGRGFCFEARQKRITFDNTHYHIDLVFYHRILKCHVLIDLKLGKFDHADAGQMNMYLNYFTDNEKMADDNPPIGIILCTQKNETLVQYATGGLSQQIFVSKYLVNLPKEEELMAFIKIEQERYPSV